MKTIIKNKNKKNKNLSFMETVIYHFRIFFYKHAKFQKNKKEKWKIEKFKLVKSYGVMVEKWEKLILSLLFKIKFISSKCIFVLELNKEF